jgi:large subunit ribosomal protein L25
MHPVLIHNVQIDPVDESILHVEFYQVDLKEKVKTKVPLVVVGESPAVAERKGVILSLLTEIDVEALPTDLPEKIEVDVSKLTEVDQEIKVSELQVPAAVTVLSDAVLGVVKVGALVSKEAEAQAAAEAEAQAASAAAAETAAPAGGAEAAPQGEAVSGEAKPAEKASEEVKSGQK